MEIKLPGERSYDPAGCTGKLYGNECINADNFNFIVAITCTIIMGAILGTEEVFVDKVLRVCRPISNQHGRD